MTALAHDSKGWVADQMSMAFHKSNALTIRTAPALVDCCRLCSGAPPIRSWLAATDDKMSLIVMGKQWLAVQTTPASNVIGIQCYHHQAINILLWTQGTCAQRASCPPSRFCFAATHPGQETNQDVWKQEEKETKQGEKTKLGATQSLQSVKKEESG